MLRRTSAGFGYAAMAGLLGERRVAASEGARVPDFRPRAKSVIFCYMSGGVSQVDSFDPKPVLEKYAGQPMPVKVERTQFNNNGTVMPSPWVYRRRGECGMEVSDLFPHIGSCADELAVVRSMTSSVNEHAQGNYHFHTGFPFMGHPSAGAWVSYGLGTENRDVPGFVVLKSGGSAVPHGGLGLWSSGFLPAQHQASVVDVDGESPVQNIRPSEADGLQRLRLDLVRRADEGFLERLGAGDALVEAAVKNYETAYRMQAAVPDLCDMRGESEATLKLYGVDDADPQLSAYARQCVMARRLVERGVRFIELTCLTEGIGAGNAANPWDQHSKLEEGHGAMAHQVDQPIAALIKDLKARGLLDETLVVWGGEFGRTPFAQGSNGRDHNPYGFSVFLAGGGVKGGTVIGETDEFGYHVVEGKKTVFDLWATVLDRMGMDHFDLTYRSGGRDVRLTDVHGEVMEEILA
ncbi:MAG: DUF1501 domain-containing protein [Verrucomicrobiota bacterium]